MGFDVLYLTPVHPIGTTNRKGRNNSLNARPGDPGSPYGIGSAEGGHDAIHPELGTFEDFDAFVARARERGMEVALDIALQCSPDHPWVTEHPGVGSATSRTAPSPTPRTRPKVPGHLPT
jgi:starch synthase (maltosyl-transferring)